MNALATLRDFIFRVLAALIRPTIALQRNQANRWNGPLRWTNPDRELTSLPYSTKNSHLVVKCVLLVLLNP